jgi:2-haloacid dehalogenase
MMENTVVATPKLILLDVYDTLLDMSPVKRRINELLDTRQGYRIWFEVFMEYCFVDNCIDRFNDFPSIAKAALQMTGKMIDTKVSDEDAESMLNLLKQLPIRQGVQKGLSSLNDQGIRVAALTNSSEDIVRERMERTGLISYFEQVLSAEHVKKYKPSLAVYRWALKKVDLPADQVMMVSTHGWDLAGAHNAGMKTAYVKLESSALFPLSPKPLLTCSGIDDLAKQLFALTPEKANEQD